MMVQIHTLSVADFKHTMRNNDLYDSTIGTVVKRIKLYKELIANAI